MSILKLIRPELLNYSNYIPEGENAKHRLHANELPWAPIETQSHHLNFYPNSGMQKTLHQQLAVRYQVEMDQLVITRGSDEGIDLVIRLFLTAGQDALMQFPPTFSMYAFFVRLQQGELLQCPLDSCDNFSLSMDKINSCWQPNCKIIIFCSPNNPTANLMDLDLIAAACDQYKNQSIVVVDEAYIEFAKAKSATTLISQFENLVILRTLSKASGLAGLRLGSIIAQAHVIEAFKKIIVPYPLSSSVMKLASSALTFESWFRTALDTIQTSRTWLINEFKKNSLIKKIYPSEANFILVKTDYAQELTSWLANQSIAIRNFPNHSLLQDHVRITVGDEQQNQLLIDKLSSFTNNVSGLNHAKDLIY